MNGGDLVEKKKKKKSEQICLTDFNIFNDFEKYAIISIKFKTTKYSNSEIVKFIKF